MFPTAIMISLSSMILPKFSTRDIVPEDSTRLPVDRLDSYQPMLSPLKPPVTVAGKPQVLSVTDLKSSSASIAKAEFVSADCSRWLTSLVYPLGRYGVMPFYFQDIEVVGQENLPTSGPVILAPTHRSRWDALMIPYAVGEDKTGRPLRFMVSEDEVKGLQGWFIRRLGGFAVNTRRPTVASLRHGVDILLAGETLVIFPEGNIFRDRQIQPLKPGFARLALQAEATQENLGIQIVPISIHYTDPLVPWRCHVRVSIGKPLCVANYDPTTLKPSAKRLAKDLQDALQSLADA
jgi:1-acyl-sn-glycerol-3-phosphate acyltransferase